MKNGTFLKILLGISAVLFVYFYIQILINGFTSLPSEGDSLLHIGFAKAILSGKFITPDIYLDTFYPAATEIILALLIFLKAPLNLYNVIAVTFLVGISFALGRQQGLSKIMALLLSISLGTLHAITRWSLTQKPDIWMIVFLFFMLFYLLKKQKSVWDFLFLGVSSGFLFGAKFTGPVFVGFVFLFFYKNFFEKISVKKTIVFLVPLILIGGFWYIRNFVIAGNPLYFQGYTPLTDSTKTDFLSFHGWQAFLYQPLTMINALISEFMLWVVGFFVIPITLFVKRNDKRTSIARKLFFIALLIFCVYLFLPASDNLTQMIGSLRYTFPGIALLVFSGFLLASIYKKEMIVGIATAVNASLIIPPSYHPKLVFIIGFGLLAVWFVFNRFRKT